MRLARLPLQAMLLIEILGMVMGRLPTVANMLLHKLLMLLDLILVQVLQQLHAELDIAQQLVTPRLGEVLADHHAQHLQVLRLGRHGVGGHDPGARAQLVGEGELVVVFVGGGVEAEGDEGEALAGLLGHDDEAELLEGVGEVVGGSGEVGHDGAVPVLAEPDELVILADDLGGAFGEVEREGGLVGS